MGLQSGWSLSSLVLFFMEPTAPFRHIHSHQQGSSPLTFANCFMAFKDFHLQRKEREEVIGAERTRAQLPGENRSQCFSSMMFGAFLCSRIPKPRTFLI